jgi:hypothetical protein
MKIQEEHLDRASGMSYYKIFFEANMKEKITADQWYEISSKLEELIKAAQTKTT